MSSLVESRHDNDAAADCSTRSATMSGGRHGRTSRPVAVSGPASSAGCRVGASSSAVEMKDYGDIAVQQRGHPPSLSYNDAARLSVKPDPTGPDGHTKPAITVPDVELQTGSRDPGSRNVPATGDNAAGEVRSRSADAASNNVKVGYVADHQRSRDDCYLPPGVAVGVPTGEETPNDCDERKFDFSTEASEQTVNARCQPYVGDSAQRCNGRQTNNGWDLSPKPEPTEARNVDRSLSAGSQYGWADVKLETYVDDSGDDVDSVPSSQFRPSITASWSTLVDCQNHVINKYGSNQPKAYGGAGNSDVISAKMSAGSRFGGLYTVTTKFYRRYAFCDLRYVVDVVYDQKCVTIIIILIIVIITIIRTP